MPLKVSRRVGKESYYATIDNAAPKSAYLLIVNGSGQIAPTARNYAGRHIALERRFIAEAIKAALFLRHADGNISRLRDDACSRQCHKDQAGWGNRLYFTKSFRIARL